MGWERERGRAMVGEDEDEGVLEDESRLILHAVADAVSMGWGRKDVE